MGSAVDSVWLTSKCPNGRQCPGYKDSSKESYCCHSKVKPGDFYCCDYATKANSEHGTVLQHHLPELVGGLVGTVALLLLVILVACFYCKCCSVYKRRKQNRTCHSSSDLSRQVDYLVQGVWSPATRQLPFHRRASYDDNDVPFFAGHHQLHYDQKSSGTPPPPYSAVCDSQWCTQLNGGRSTGTQL